MAQGALIIPGSPLTGANLANDINTAFSAFASLSSGTSAPTLGPGAAGALVAGQLWLDTSLTQPVLFMYNGSVWVPFFGLTLLNTLTAVNSASLSDTTSISSAFNDYEVVFDNILPAATADFNMTVKSGGSFQATGYLNTVGGATTYTDISGGATVYSGGSGLSGTLRMFNANSTANAKVAQIGVAFINNSGALAAGNTAGMWAAGSGAITGLSFQMSSGNITTGTIKIFGLRSS